MSFTSRSKLFARLFVGILLAGAAAFGQSISIVSGDGQALLAATTVPQALVVLVRDASGNPLPNATVAWAVVTLQGGALQLTTTKTDSNGLATNSLVSPQVPPNASFFQTQINAVYSTKTVTFTETVVGQFEGGPEVGITLKSPVLGYSGFVGAAGQHSSTLIQVLIQGSAGAQSGQPVAHVLIQIGPEKGYTSTLTCVEGPNLFTDVHGQVTCTPVFGGAIGTGVLSITAGANAGILGQFTFNYQVTSGPPAIIAIVSGNNQSGQPGVPLPRPLVAQVTDIAGNWLSGIQLAFKAVVPGAVGFSNVNNVSDVHGLVSATATPGNVSGPVQVSVQTADGKVFATFTINVAVNIGQIMKSGDQQTGTTLQPFADPLTITVTDTHGNPIVGAQVTFAVTQGAGTLGLLTAVTNAQGQASTTVAAGGTPGPLVITATVAGTGSGTVATFNLTVLTPGPNCTPGQTFYNGAGFQANYISPGAVATIYCVGLAQGIQGSVMPSFFGPLPTQVAGVSLTFATAADPTAALGVPNAPIFNVSNYNGQESVSVEVPLDALVGSNVPVTITVNGVSTTGVTATILQAAPGVFDMGLAGTDGLRAAVILRPDGSVVSPSNALARGEIGRAYVTGLIPPAGLTTNAQLPIDGDIVITTPVIVGVNNAGVKVISVKYARNLVGVWEVQFEVPTSAKTGSNIPFAVAVPTTGGNAYSQTSDIAIQ
jgi:uncharacterized protein (TIGR03437 family)